MKINEIDPGEKQTFEPSNTDLSKSFGKFLSDCSESIAAMQATNTFLYRGMSNIVSPDIFIGRSREHRNSLTFKPSVSKQIDKQFIKAGFKTHRSNSIFCTSLAGVAVTYGRLYMIFPINGFDFAWSSEVYDFATNNRLATIANINPKEFDPIEFSYSDTNLKGALMSGKEIMIHGTYYAFRYSKYGKGLSKALKVALP
jgi:hypothetical protein